ncbi:recombinase family protein [Oscillospiraceae bacterium OttesenSCG-928-F05]|nr:recombinase family protein [Oscillospiraceae bacterium OttesenSCG-928-F05]
MPKKAAIYIRVSTDAQREEGYSIDAQREMLTAHCVSKGLKHMDYYIDGGFTGSNIDRPELRRLIADAKAGKLSHVIVYKLDRLSRSQKDTLYLIEDVFNPHGVDFVSLQETMDTSTPMGRLMLGILSAFAQLERENIRERTRMGMLERVKDGYWMGGGRVPFGYDYDSEQGILVPNEDAETVRRIYDLYLKGYPLYKIAQIVGLKYERLARQILNRKSNYGVIAYNGKEYVGRHTPIIDRDTYERAMAMQRERSSKKFHAASRYLLTGLVYCGKCGAKMRYQKWGKRGEKLVCYSQEKNKPHLVRDPNCTQPKLWADEVEDTVLTALFALSLDPGEAGEMTGEVTVLEMLWERSGALEKKLKRLYNLYAGSDDDVLLETIDEVKRELHTLGRQIDVEEERGVLQASRRKLQQEVRDLKNTWTLMTGQERQTVARQMIKRVVLTDETVDLELHF